MKTSTGYGWMTSSKQHQSKTLNSPTFSHTRNCHSRRTLTNFYQLIEFKDQHVGFSFFLIWLLFISMLLSFSFQSIHFLKKKKISLYKQQHHQQHLHLLHHHHRHQWQHHNTQCFIIIPFTTYKTGGRNNCTLLSWRSTITF